MQDILTNPYTWIAVLSVLIVLFVILCLVIGRDKNKAGKVKRYPVASVDIGMAQFIGTREKQDDSFGVHTNGNGTFAIVADGIGGFMDGDVASRIAVDTFIENFKMGNVSNNINFFFNSSAITANERIRKQFGDKMCGTTVVAAIVADRKLYYTSIGDSIISVFRNGRLIPVNTKHNVESYLEDQDFFRMNGIFRDCYLLQRPEGHIKDVQVIPNDTCIEIVTDGRVDIRILEKDVLLYEGTFEHSFSYTPEHPILWNAEKPYLYSLTFTYEDEIITQKIGFVTYTIGKDREFLVNGVEVKLKGVNHHDTHPQNGWTVTEIEMRTDLELMKKLNM